MTATPPLRRSALWATTALGLAVPAAADFAIPADTTLIASYSPATIDAASNFVADEFARAVGFTLPAGPDYRLDGAILDLAPDPFGGGSGAGADPQLTLYRGDDPQDPVLAFDDPVGGIASGANTFAAPDDAVLDAGQRYWLVLVNEGAADSVFGWFGEANPSPTFTGIVDPDTGSYRQSSVDDVFGDDLPFPPTGTLDQGDARNAFAVYGTVVPEPATLALVGLGLVAAIRHRRAGRAC